MVNCGGAILRSGGTCVPRRSGFGTPTPNPLPLSGGGGFRAGAAPPPPAKGASLRLPPLNPPQAGGCPPAPSSRGGCPPAPLRTVCSARGTPTPSPTQGGIAALLASAMRFPKPDRDVWSSGLSCTPPTRLTARLPCLPLAQQRKLRFPKPDRDV